MEVIEDLPEELEEIPETEPIRQPYMRRGRKQTDGTRQVLTKVHLMQLKHKVLVTEDDQMRASLSDNLLDIEGQGSEFEQVESRVQPTDSKTQSKNAFFVE